MGQTKRKASNVLLDDLPVQSQSSRSVLRDVAVAIDPPPEGAVGIRELLDRLDFLVEADFFLSKERTLDTGHSPFDLSSSWNIYDFADPQTSTRPIDITGWHGDDLQLILRKMIRIRETSNALADLAKNSPLTTVTHPAIGWEAVATGISCNVTSQDQLFGNYLFPTHSLTVTDEVFPLIARLTGKDTTTNLDIKPAHLTSLSADEFWNDVETTFSQFTDNQKQAGNMVVAYIDAEGFEQPLAQKMLKLFQEKNYPVLLVCERLLPRHASETLSNQKSSSVAQLADNASTDWAVVDGNDVIAIAKASGSLTDRIRKGRGIGFLEAVRFDHDLTNEFSDPIARLKQAMIARGDINHASFEILQTLEKQIINATVTNSQAVPAI